jgi:hypothetical protein
LHFSWKRFRQSSKQDLSFTVNTLLAMTSTMAPPPSQALMAACPQQQMDAIDLLLEDLGSVDPMLQHRASFQSCWRELTQLRAELVNLLISRRRLVREATAKLHLGEGS